VTRYSLVARYDFLSKLEVTLETGRTHQIRVHLRHIGHHVFGDPDYGGREQLLRGFSPETRITAKRLLARVGRQALHSSRLSFVHPFTGEKLDFTSPLPEDLAWLENELMKR
jgi:23S rRNA pseudouridine1911/1915/1917 synthase